MTILGLNKFLRDRGVKDKNVHISELNGKVVAIDAHLYLNRLFRSPLVNDGSDNITIFSMFKTFHQELEEGGALPIYVFDGGYPEEKRATQLKRRKQWQSDRDRNEKIKTELKHLLSSGGEPSKQINDVISRIRNQRIKHAFNDPRANFMKNQTTVSAAKELIKILTIRSAYISKDDIETLKADMVAANWLCVQAPLDGEAMCVQMVKEGYADYAMSTDSDLVAMGCERIITRVTKTEITIRDIGEILKKLEFPINNEGKMMLLDFCILQPTDFTQEKINGVGSTTAHRIISRYRKLENIPCIKKKDATTSNLMPPLVATSTTTKRPAPGHNMRNGVVQLSSKEQQDLLRVKEIFMTPQVPVKQELYNVVKLAIKDWRDRRPLTHLKKDEKLEKLTRPTVNLGFAYEQIVNAVKFNNEDEEAKKKSFPSPFNLRQTSPFEITDFFDLDELK